MHPSMTMRSTDASIPDLPPASFDYDATMFDSAVHDEPAPRKTITDYPAIAEGAATRQAIKIARAVTGTSEIRLLRQTIADKADTFILETAVLQPYHAVRVNLTRHEGDRPIPLNLVDALIAFHEAVLAKYPAETLRNGRSISIHMNLK